VVRREKGLAIGNCCPSGRSAVELEAYVSTKVHAGEPLWGNYPPGEDLKAEYYKASLAGADEVPG
jgi:hypothetical protein